MARIVGLRGNGWTMRYMQVIWAIVFLAVHGFGQNTVDASTLPSAPAPQEARPQIAMARGQQMPQPATPQSTSALSTPQAAGTRTLLSVQDAQALALKNNPQITVGRLTALASQQVTREVRSAYWPQAQIALTAVDAPTNTRVTAGALNNPLIYERAAAGAMVSQLVTDFGRTSNLVASSNLAAKAENQNALATKEQILLAVDQAFYGAMQAQAVLTVAQQTVKDRQTVSDQVGALFRSKLKSQLDLSFANVNLAQAQLLLVDAQNNLDATQATLSSVLGFQNLQNFQLVDDTSPVEVPPDNIDELISTAFSMRPEILALQYQTESAKRFQKAERDLLLPDIRAIGAVGDTPVRNPAIDAWYGTVGVNMDIPVFNGFLYTARAKEASLRAQATQERLRDLKDRIARDVRTSWLNAKAAHDRLAVTQQLLEQADLSLNLAQSRYKLGLGSIVELSQAQLQETQAQIANAEAGYDYRLSLAVLQYQTKGI